MEQTSQPTSRALLGSDFSHSSGPSATSKEGQPVEGSPQGVDGTAVISVWALYDGRDLIALYGTEQLAQGAAIWNNAQGSGARYVAHEMEVEWEFDPLGTLPCRIAELIRQNYVPKQDGSEGGNEDLERATPSMDTSPESQTKEQP